MNSIVHSRKMERSRRRYLSRRHGGAPGERGPWASWDALNSDEHASIAWDLLDDPWWCELDVHIYLAWTCLLPERRFGLSVLPGGVANSIHLMNESASRDDGANNHLKALCVSDGEDIAAALAQYAELLHDDSGKLLKRLRANISEVLATSEGRFFQQLAHRHLLEDPECSHAGIIVSLLHLRPFWIRPLSTWSHADVAGTEWIESLVNHLLVQFPVPRFIHRDVWASRFSWGGRWVPGFFNGKTAMWFILTARGISLHRAAAHFGWVVPKGLVHWLAQAPEELSLTDATLWAEIMRLGGSTVEFERLRRHYGFQMDLTSGDVNRKSCLQPLRETIRWIILHRDELTEESCATILGWYSHEFTEIRAGRGGPSLKGRSVQRVLRVARAYFAERNKPYVNLSWQNRCWDWEMAMPDSTTWTIRELNSGVELHEEGMALAHCVGGYAHRCAAGEAAIFSLQLNGQRRLTIEVSLPAKAVVQVRGTCNRPATAEEQEIVERWRLEAVAS